VIILKKLDRLKNKVKFDKSLVIFLLVLGIVGLVSGAFFVTVLNNTDTELVKNHLQNFVNNIENGNLDYLYVFKNNIFTNLFYVLIIWLLGISVIGLPILVIIYFSKTFILGFSIGSIISVYKLKGILFSIVYVFPGQVFNLIAIFILTMYSISFSIKLIYAVFRKKTIDFKFLINKYMLILVICAGVIILTSLYDTFLMPRLVSLLVPFIK